MAVRSYTWVGWELGPYEMISLCNLWQIGAYIFGFVQRCWGECFCTSVSKAKEINEVETVQNPIEPLARPPIWSLSQGESAHRHVLGPMLKFGPKRYYSVGEE